MGWKTVRDHYRINRQVTVTDGIMQFGEAATATFDGRVVRASKWSQSNEVERWIADLEADPRELAQLMAAPDAFGPSVRIYTYKGDEIVEDLCENPEWPGVTHSGDAIFENTHSTDRDVVVQWAIENAAAMITACIDQVAEAERVLEMRLDSLDETMAIKASLDAQQAGSAVPKASVE